MKETDILLDVLGDVDDEFIPDISDEKKSSKKNISYFYIVPVAAACFTLILTAKYFQKPENINNPEINNIVMNNTTTTGSVTDRNYRVTTYITDNEHDKLYYETTQLIAATQPEGYEKPEVTNVTAQPQMSDHFIKESDKNENTPITIPVIMPENTPITLPENILTTRPVNTPVATSENMPATIPIKTSAVTSENMPVTIPVTQPENTSVTATENMPVISLITEKTSIPFTTTELITNTVTSESTLITYVSDTSQIKIPN